MRYVGPGDKVNKGWGFKKRERRRMEVKKKE